MIHAATRISGLLLATLLFGLLSACTVSFNGPQENQVISDPGDDAERKAAIKAAARFLKLLDQGRYEETWSLTGRYLHDTTSAKAWARVLRTARSVTGEYKSRDERLKAGFTETLEKAVPKGHYFVLSFNTEFTGGQANERVILNLENGEWRVVGYFAFKHWGAESDA